MRHLTTAILAGEGSTALQIWATQCTTGTGPYAPPRRTHHGTESTIQPTCNLQSVGFCHAPPQPTITICLPGHNRWLWRQDSCAYWPVIAIGGKRWRVNLWPGSPPVPQRRLEQGTLFVNFCRGAKWTFTTLRPTQTSWQDWQSHSSSLAPATAANNCRVMNFMGNTRLHNCLYATAVYSHSLAVANDSWQINPILNYFMTTVCECPMRWSPIGPRSFPVTNCLVATISFSMLAWRSSRAYSSSFRASTMFHADSLNLMRAMDNRCMIPTDKMKPIVSPILTWSAWSKKRGSGFPGRMSPCKPMTKATCKTATIRGKRTWPILRGFLPAIRSTNGDRACGANIFV